MVLKGTVQWYGSCVIIHYFASNVIITKLEVYVVFQCSHKDGVDIVGHACAQVGRPRKHKEGLSSTNKHICISNAMFVT